MGYYPQLFRLYCHSYRIETQGFFCVVAEKWLKRNYIVNDREREGEKRGKGGRKAERKEREGKRVGKELAERREREGKKSGRESGQEGIERRGS